VSAVSIPRSEQGSFLLDVGQSFELTGSVVQAAASTLRSDGLAVADADTCVDHILMQCEIAPQLILAPVAVLYPAR